MYSENLDKLIELALADGVLTEKEKQVLFKKAEAEGIDHNEFEMVLDGMLFERNKNPFFVQVLCKFAISNPNYHEYFKHIYQIGNLAK